LTDRARDFGYTSITNIASAPVSRREPQQRGGVVRIGLVLVHGVGEQRRFDHLCAEVKNFVAALSTVPNLKVTVDTRSTQDSETHAAHESWRADGSAPVKIHVKHELRGEVLCLCVHEVWWADLDDKETLWNRFKFWLWGLGFWGVKKFSEARLQGGQLDMQPPKFPPFGWGGDVAREIFVRARLWTFANVFLLSALTVNVANYVLRQLRLGQLPLPGIEVFYQFVGDVKLYQDRGKPHVGPLTDLGDPRRVAIRRRLIQVLVDAYREQYDRWYVVAHSLGTVVALNGLMETDHALPNYLNRETWESLVAARDRVIGKLPQGKARSVDGMRPARPAWIAANDAILDRKVLFARLRGLVTYGSPLDKFAYLWSQIVNINNDVAPWQPGNGERTLPFEWINVFDHTDPVSAGLNAYEGGAIPTGSPKPVNLAYKASGVLLLSHLKYLVLRQRGQHVPQDQFVLRLLAWILQGDAAFQPPNPQTDRSWYRRTSGAFGLALRAPMWIVVAALLTAALGYLGIPAILEIVKWLAGLPLLAGTGIDAFFTELERSFARLSLVERMLGVLVASAAIVTLAGAVRRFLEREPRGSGAAS
jgi:hypothetical protein